MRLRLSDSAVESPTSAPRFGLALVAVSLAVLAGPGTGAAGATGLQPCKSTNPTGPIVTLDGDLTIEPRGATRRAWRRSGVRQSLIRPANSLGGRPEFPVSRVRYGKTARIDFKGGIRFHHKDRKVALRGISVRVRAGKPAWLRAKIGRRTINLLVVKGGKRFYNAKSGKLSRSGPARLTAAGARLLNGRLHPAKRLRAGTSWGAFSLFSIYKVTEVEDPTGETPEVPPIKVAPAGAETITGATSIKWYVRDTFIDYVAAGQGTRVADGAIADPPTGPKNLSYSYNFPFDTVSGSWTSPESGSDSENTLLRARGTVGFRYCRNTINFTVSDPEIELDGDAASRIIFHVNGTDGTAFPDQRAVMVKLIPGLAESHTVTANGDGSTTVNYTKIPGFVPAEGTGLFADIYPPFSTAFDGQNPRPDRFGFLSVSYTYETGGA